MIDKYSIGDFVVSPNFKFDSIQVFDPYVNCLGFSISEGEGYIPMSTKNSGFQHDKLFAYSRWSRTPNSDDSTFFSKGTVIQKMSGISFQKSPKNSLIHGEKIIFQDLINPKNINGRVESRACFAI